MAKHVILFLAANPTETDQQILDLECAAIHQELTMSSGGRTDFELASRWAVSVDELGRHLRELDPVVIHFSGHGGGSRGLILQGDRGTPQLVSARALQKVIDSTTRRARVAVLNACYRVEQAYGLRSSIDCVVGMTSAIGDEAARSFAGAFYRALGYRRSVAEAFDHAVAMLHGKGDSFEDEEPARDCKAGEIAPVAGAPQCLTRDGVDARRVMLWPVASQEGQREGTDVPSPVLLGASTLPPAAERQAGTTKVLIVLEVTLSHFRATELANVLAELQQLSGDATLQIATIEEGSVRLTVVTTKDGARRLLELHASGQLTQLDGLEVSVVREMPAFGVRAARAVDAAAEVWQQVTRQRIAANDSLEGLLGLLGDPARGLQRSNIEDIGADTETSVDEDIRELIRAGDHGAALAALMQRYGQTIRSHIRAALQLYSKDASLVEDIHQQVFLDVYQQLPRYASTRPFTSWLREIARRHILDHRSYQFRAPSLMNVSVLPANASARATMTTALERCLDQLRPDVRAVVILRLQHGMSIKDIAAMTNVEANIVSQRLARALQVLRRCLECKGIVT